MTSPESSAMDPAFLAFFVVPRWPPFPPGSHPLPPANSAGCVLYRPQWGHVLPGGCSVWLGVEYADAGSLGHVHPDVAGGSALSEMHRGCPGGCSQMQGWGQGGEQPPCTRNQPVSRAAPGLSIFHQENEIHSLSQKRHRTKYHVL